MLRRVVYIVDDDEAVRDSMAFFLGSVGLVVHAYSCGPSFLERRMTLEPGCVLLDIRMAEMDGFQVIENLDAKRAQLPVIVMTGHGDVVTAVRAMKLGAGDFLQKPFEESVLLEILDRQFSMLSHQLAEDERRRPAQQRVAELTVRETDVLRGLASGRSNKVLAYELGLSPRTVEMHRARMLDRLHVRTLPAALKLFFDAGVDLVSAAPGASETSSLVA